MNTVMVTTLPQNSADIYFASILHRSMLTTV